MIVLLIAHLIVLALVLALALVLLLARSLVRLRRLLSVLGFMSLLHFVLVLIVLLLFATLLQVQQIPGRVNIASVVVTNFIFIAHYPKRWLHIRISRVIMALLT